MYCESGTCHHKMLLYVSLGLEGILGKMYYTYYIEIYYFYIQSIITGGQGSVNEIVKNVGVSMMIFFKITFLDKPARLMMLHVRSSISSRCNALFSALKN